jgi:uncharacterized protein
METEQEQMATNRYETVYQCIEDVKRQLGEQTQLATLFAQCFPNTLETTTELLEDGTTFVFTGDIPALWLRDSSAQVNPYIALAADDPALQRMLRGLIQRQACYLQIDPYANSFNREPNGKGHTQDRPTQGPDVWERKYELDSLCYPLKLCYTYWQATRDETIFTDDVLRMFQAILAIMKTEQHHTECSEYRFERLEPSPPSDSLPFAGRGTRVNFTGMIWSGFRPSDDACRFGYLVPANMFAVVVLGYLATMAREIYGDTELAERASKLQAEVEFGIQTYGVVEHPRFGRIYAYETDGFGNYNLMDDANVPSLLAIPYMQYRPANDPLYLRTRRFVLSASNPYYFQGQAARGVGSPHTPHRYIWPIALSMQGLTAISREEQDEVLDLLVGTTAGTNYMHESFDADDATQFTRPWFAWANSLFSEFLLHYLGMFKRNG